MIVFNTNLKDNNKYATRIIILRIFYVGMSYERLKNCFVLWNSILFKKKDIIIVNCKKVVRNYLRFKEDFKNDYWKLIPVRLHLHNLIFEIYQMKVKILSVVLWLNCKRIQNFTFSFYFKSMLKEEWFQGWISETLFFFFRGYINSFHMYNKKININFFASISTFLTFGFLFSFIDIN